MTAQDLITKTLQTLGVVAAGETPATEELSDGLVALNDLIESWSAQGLPIPQLTRVELALTGAASYNLVTRALLIKAVAVVNDGLQTPYEVVDATVWAAGDRNRVLWYDGGYPTGVIRLRPSPSAGSLEMYSYHALTPLATLATVIALPPGYQRGLRFGLVADLAPEYGRVLDDALIGLANDAKLAIQGLNRALLGPVVPPAPGQTA
ncbi:MAG: hypothetical protein ABFD89_29330 [Bryobacteraceae bacterium]